MNNWRILHVVARSGLHCSFCLSMSSSRDFSSALGVSVDPSLLGKRRSGNVACQRGMEARELQRAADSREY